MVTFEEYAKDTVIIHNDRFGFDLIDQRVILEWFKKHRPALWNAINEGRDVIPPDKRLELLKDAYIQGKDVTFLPKNHEDVTITIENSALPDIISMLMDKEEKKDGKD